MPLALVVSLQACFCACLCSSLHIIAIVALKTPLFVFRACIKLQKWLLRAYAHGLQADSFTNSESRRDESRPPPGAAARGDIHPPAISNLSVHEKHELRTQLRNPVAHFPSQFCYTHLVEALDTTIAALHHIGHSKFHSLDALAYHIVMTPGLYRAVDARDSSFLAAKVGLPESLVERLVTDRSFRVFLHQYMALAVCSLQDHDEMWRTVITQIKSLDVPLSHKKGVLELIQQQLGILKAKRIEARIDNAIEVTVKYGDKNPYLDAIDVASSESLPGLASETQAVSATAPSFAVLGSDSEASS